MTAQTRTVNKARFETGDTPQGSDYVNLIDSYLSLADSTAQSLSSPLTMAGSLGVAATASASALEVLGVVRVSGAATFNSSLTAASVTTSALSVSGNAVIQGDLDVQGTLAFTQTNVGEIYLDATAAVSASATYVEVIGAATADSTFLVNFAVTAGSVIYQGTATRSFLGLLAISLAASSNNTETFVTFGVDGSAITRLEEVKNLGTTTDDELEIHGMLRLSQNERVSPMIRTDAAGASGWAVKRLVLTVKE